MTDLPKLDEAFGAARLSDSKVRALTRMATNASAGRSFRKVMATGDRAKVEAAR